MSDPGQPTPAALEGTGCRLREAAREDLPAILTLLADDQLGAARDDPGPDRREPYERAFAAIDADPCDLLLVAADGDGVVGTMQLSFLPGLARQGAWRAQIEAVRVARSHRNRGLGSAMTAWAIDEARRRDCALVQLTSDKRRGDAHRFYGRLGFVASHDGFKLQL